jgi:Na+/H+ antiporter NhaC
MNRAKVFFPVRVMSILLWLLSACFSSLPAQSGELQIKTPRIALTGIPVSIEVTPSMNSYLQADSGGIPYIVSLSDGTILSEGSAQLSPKSPGNIVISGLTFSESGTKNLQIRFGEQTQQIRLRVIPGFLSILPPLLAIALALITRQVIVALFFGIWLGAVFVFDYSIFMGFLRTLDEYIINALSNRDHVFIVVFSLLLGGMVGVISKSGGTQGIVDKLAQYAQNARGGQIATWLMGVLIFFDDYANSLIVGNTMRPLSDKLRISREKLSYLVDSTAAPVSNIAIISTWIGYEVSLINQAYQTHGIEGNAYITFIQTIPYNFYPLFSLFMGLLIAVMMRDFGPMYKAEHRTRTTGKVLSDHAAPLMDLGGAELLADENTPKRWYNALIPLGAVILTVSIGLFATGWESGLSELAKEMALEGKTLADAGFIRKMSAIVGASNSFSVLMWASFIGGVVGIVLAMSQRLLSLQQALDAWVGGIKSMMMACIILTAAWAIGSICGDLFTADYVVSISQNFLSVEWLPTIIFVSAAVVAFSTGTSWGTMAILMPIAIPMAHKFALETPGMDEAHATGMLLCVTASVLAGATFGDHCSPISDTTILSSMASGADHIDHVRTQLPYAISAAAIACIFGYIPVGFGLNHWLTLPLGAVATWALVRFVGKPTP